MQTGTDDAPASFGHNSGARVVELDIAELQSRLIDRLREHEARRDDLLDAGLRFHTANSEIATDDVQARATDFVRQMRALLREIEELRKSEKTPIIAAGRMIENVFGGFVCDLATECVAVERKMTAYAVARRLRLRAQAEAEAARKREEAAQAERDALANRTSLDVAISKSQEADAATQIATASAAALSRVHSDFGGVSSLRTTLLFRVTNPDAVPRHFLCINEDALKAAGKAWREGHAQPVPGVEFYFKEKVAVR